MNARDNEGVVLRKTPALGSTEAMYGDAAAHKRHGGVYSNLLTRAQAEEAQELWLESFWQAIAAQRLADLRRKNPAQAGSATLRYTVFLAGLACGALLMLLLLALAYSAQGGGL